MSCGEVLIIFEDFFRLSLCQFFWNNDSGYFLCFYSANNDIFVHSKSLGYLCGRVCVSVSPSFSLSSMGICVCVLHEYPNCSAFFIHCLKCIFCCFLCSRFYSLFLFPMRVPFPFFFLVLFVFSSLFSLVCCTEVFLVTFLQRTQKAARDRDCWQTCSPRTTVATIPEMFILYFHSHSFNRQPGFGVSMYQAVRYTTCGECMCGGDCYTHLIPLLIYMYLDPSI